MSHVVDYRLRGCCKAAEACKALAECSHNDVHLVLEAEVGGRSAAAFADCADSVGIVDHNAGIVAAGEVHDFGKLGDIAAHGEDSVGHDELRGIGPELLEHALEAVHVVVEVADHLCVRELGPVVDAGVVLAVADDVIAFGADGAEDSEVALEAGGECHRGFLVQEGREFLLEIEVQVQGSVEES